MSLTDTLIPAWVALALGVATLGMLLGVVALTVRANRIKARLGTEPTAKDQRAERLLFTAALVPSLLVIAAVMAISFVGLASFAETDMGWHSWIRFIVPVSLDGIAITFGFWAFVAVKRGRHPGRSERIVFAGAFISALINFNHGRQEWTGAAGLYLGFLSLASGWMFHELLAQFMDGQEDLPKKRRHGTPAFGERWIWAPWSTLMARRSWAVYPPAEDLESTPANALAHHEAQQERKRSAKLAKIVPATAEAHTPAPSTQDEDTTTAVPVPVQPRIMTGAPLPSQLLHTARQAAQQFQTDNGRAITRDELQKLMRVSNATTGDIMRALDVQASPRQLATAAVSPLTGNPLL